MSSPTLSTAILISMVVSLTTTPMMCAHLLKDEQVKARPLLPVSERIFDGMLSVYGQSLTWALENRGPMLWCY